MDVITRKVDESVLIGDDITVLIVAVRGKQVRIGVKVPEGVPINRKELYEILTDPNSEDDPTSGDK